MTAPRFFFITNDAAKAALEFSCHPGNVPSWMAILDNLDLWLRIPDGSKCMGLWYGSAGEMEGWRNSWATRTERGGISGITPDELAKIHAWCVEHRERPSLALLYGVEITSDTDCEEAAVGLPAASGRGEAVIPPAAIIDRPTDVVKRSSKWT